MIGRAAIGASFVLCGAAGSAQAQDGLLDNGGEGWGVALTVENDMFVPGDGTDRYYTQGMKLSVLTGDRSGGSLGKALLSLVPEPEQRDWRLRTVFGLGQHMYTPEAKNPVVPDPLDRPYAGWLYGSYSGVAYSPDQVAGLEVQVGVVGPDAHAGPLQNWWHRVIGAPPVNGWASELDNEIGVNLHGEWRRRLSTPPWEGWGADLIGIGTAALGNVETSIGAGAVGRVGFNLKDDFGPPRLRPGPAATEFFEGGEAAFYLFGGVYARAVGRDIFLDGNTFGDTPSVPRETVVPEYTLGVVLRTPRSETPWGWQAPPVRFGYSWVKREHEFEGQRGPSEYGAFSVAIVANGLRLW